MIARKTQVALMLMTIVSILGSPLVKGASSNSAIVDQIYGHLGDLGIDTSENKEN